ncbi:hypothetical protein JMJ77_0011296, partial [Colletotrichum scovillei]
MSIKAFFVLWRCPENFSRLGILFVTTSVQAVAHLRRLSCAANVVYSEEQASG